MKEWETVRSLNSPQKALRNRKSEYAYANAFFFLNTYSTGVYRTSCGSCAKETASLSLST
jgi:hypothetical protein